jgi:hypothetical protein
MTQHTQKQWLEINKMHKGGWTIEVRSLDGVLIHSAPKTSMSIKTKKANAKLIAAAPDLLEMLTYSSRVLKFLLDEKSEFDLKNKYFAFIEFELKIKQTISDATGDLV